MGQHVQEYRGLSGGAQKSGVTVTPVGMDLSALAWHKVLIWSQDQNLRVCFAPLGTNPTTLAAEGTDQAAGSGARIAYNIAKGFAVPFIVTADQPLLIVATDSGSGTVKVKNVGRVEAV